jgi:hypothetical protein
MQNKNSNSKKSQSKSVHWNDNTQQEQLNNRKAQKQPPTQEDNQWDTQQLTIPIEDSKEKQKDWNIENLFYSQYLQLPQKSALPSSTDLRNNFPLPIHQQKRGVFSCIGYAVTDMVHWHFYQIGGLKIKKFSARFNWMAAKEIDTLTSRPTTFIEQAGSTLKAGLDVCRKYGSVDDELLPTESDSLFQGTTQQFYAQASKYKISAYYSLMLPPIEMIAGKEVTKEQRQKLQLLIWKIWINNNHPILVRVNVDKTFYNAKDNLLENYQESNNFQKHAALLVGYDEEGFILRNSWGKEWGDKGYARLSNQYAFEALDEAYGITVPSNEVGNPPPPKPHEKTLLEKLLNLFD